MADQKDLKFASGEQAVGRVETTAGKVMAVRADGTRVELNAGDPVFQGDTITTAEGSAVGVMLVDETVFSMGQSGETVLDEAIYDAAAQVGSIVMSLTSGVLTVVSGMVSKLDPDAMVIQTQTATIGIRGTQVGLHYEDGENLRVTLMEESDGMVGEVIVTNSAGVQVLNMPYAEVSVLGAASAPGGIYLVGRAAMVSAYAESLGYLPQTIPSANRYETSPRWEAGTESVAEPHEDAEDFETQAGGEPRDDVGDEDVDGGEAFPPIQVASEEVAYEPEAEPPIEVSLRPEPPSETITPARGTEAAERREEPASIPEPQPEPEPEPDPSAEIPSVSLYVTPGNGNQIDVTVNAAFGDYLDGSELHQVRLSVPDGFSLAADDVSDWSDLPSGVTAVLDGPDVVFTAATGEEGIGDFAYTMSMTENYKGALETDFSVQAEAIETETGDVAASGATQAVLIGTSGKDELTGGMDAEVIIGAEGKDKISGGEGDDVIYGEEGKDDLSGGEGDDILFGGEGKDKISGGEGDDILVGGAGKDEMTGGEGGDTFLFNPGEDGGAKDSITDFGIGDQLRLEGGEVALDDVVITQDGNDTIIQVNGNETEIILHDVQADQLASYQTTPEPGSDIIVAHQGDVPG